MIMKRIITSILLGAVLSVCSLGINAQALPDDIVLKNDHVELRFGGSEKNFFFRYFYFDGVNILPSTGSVTHPWEVTLLGPNGENPTLQPKFTYYKGGKFEEKDGVQKATFTWNLVIEAQEWPLNISVTLAPDDDMPHWTMDASMPEGWILTQADYPRIMVKRLEGEAKGILPYGYGAEYDMPTNSHLQMRYPSVTGMMEMVMMHNGESTVYFAAEDTLGCNKLLTMKGEGNNVVFYQSAITSYAWSEGGHFQLPWSVVMGYNPQNWQKTAVKWYRPFSFTTKWGEKTIAQRQIAPWIKNADMWLRPIDVTPEMKDALYKALAYYGKGVGLHWYFWQHLPYDTNYPDYFPAKDGFKEAIEKSQKMGAFVTPYINGRLWDTANHTYKELDGKDASCRKTDGSLYTEVYSSKVINTVTCPSSPIWQKIIYDLNDRILTELGTNGVYIDQIGCAASVPCYAPNHDHAPGAVLIADEVQCGVFRSGKPFAFQTYGVAPDIMSLAKGIADGVPMGAVVARKEIADVFKPGDHGSTFGGSCLAVAACAATLSALVRGDDAEPAAKVGAYMETKLAALPHVIEVRGRGMMLGCDFDDAAGDAHDIVARALAAGAVINATGAHTLRFLPPLVCEEADVDSLVEILSDVLA